MSESQDGVVFSESPVNKSAEQKQNDLIARREVRRRKILENAQNRLEKLSSTENCNSIANHRQKRDVEEDLTEVFPDPEADSTEIHYNHNSTFSLVEPLNHSDWTPPESFNVPSEEVETPLRKLLTSRLHIITTSLLTYVLLIFGFKEIVSYGIFSLLLIVECAELLLQREKPMNPALSVLLVFLRLNVHKTGFIIKFLGTINKLLYDIAIFIFCFVIAHWLQCTLFENEATNTFSLF